MTQNIKTTELRSLTEDHNVKPDTNGAALSVFCGDRVTLSSEAKLKVVLAMETLKTHQGK